MTDENTNVQDHSELVTVFESGQESNTQVVIGLLESAGIECMETSIDASQDIFPGAGGTAVRVAPTDAEAARSIIAAYRDNTEAEQETGS